MCVEGSRLQIQDAPQPSRRCVPGTNQRLSLGRWSGNPLSEYPRSDSCPRRRWQRHGQTDLVVAETEELLEMLFPDSRNGDFIHRILNSPQKRGDAVGIT